MESSSPTFQACLNAIASPVIHYMLTDSKWGKWRSKYERCISLLPPAARSRIQRRLREDARNTANFQRKCHELYVGSLFAEWGYEVEYEPRCGTQTPDWIARNTRGKLIIDVTSRNVRPEQDAVDASLNLLVDLLHMIRGNAKLIMEFQRPDAHIPIDDDQIVRIVERTEAWLATSPPIGDEKICFDDANLVFRFAEPNTIYHGILVLGGAHQPPHGHPAVEAIILEKLNKYRDLVETERCPFIVALSIDPRLGMAFDDLRYMLVQRQKPLFTEQTEHEEHKLLSACLCFEAPDRSGESSYEVIINTHATYCLPTPLKLNANP